jgi:hypothetical protein
MYGDGVNIAARIELLAIGKYVVTDADPAAPLRAGRQDARGAESLHLLAIHDAGAVVVAAIRNGWRFQ